MRTVLFSQSHIEEKQCNCGSKQEDTLHRVTLYWFICKHLNIYIYIIKTKLCCLLLFCSSDMGKTTFSWMLREIRGYWRRDAGCHPLHHQVRHHRVVLCHIPLFLLHCYFILYTRCILFHVPWHLRIHMYVYEASHSQSQLQFRECVVSMLRAWASWRQLCAISSACDIGLAKHLAFHRDRALGDGYSCETHVNT